MDLLDSIFEIKYAKSTGDSTQQQFATLSEYFYGDKFSSPHSLKNKGDKGANGIVSKEGIYFQVFSPENNQDKKAYQKMETDLQTIIDTSLYIQYNPIKKYIFFYNQPKEVSLSSAFIAKKLELEHKFKIEVAIWQFSHLKRNLFDTLSHNDKKNYLGIHGNKYIFNIKVMEDVYNHIINYGNGGNGIMSADAGQGFVEKIDYNGFDDAWRAFWNVGIKHIGGVTDYFKSRPEKQQECYKVVTESYQEMSKQSDDSNEIIKNMVIKFAPDTEKPENLYHISYILVHFFAKCSIFKKNI